MKTTRLLISALWLISLIAAFIIGGKINTPSASRQHSEDTSSTHRPSQRLRSGTHPSSTRHTIAGNKTKTRAGSSHQRQLSITEIAQNDDPISRANELLRFINRLGTDDFAQVVAEFRELGITQERMGEYAMLLHAWAKVDPLSALDYAEKNTGTRFARQTILTSWAADDPDAALLWAKEHYKGDGANPWLIGIIRGVVGKDLARATEILQTLPYSRERGEALSAIIPHIAQQGIEKASEWLESISDERLREGGTSFLAAALARHDPKATAEWVASLPESNGKSRATRQLAGEWARQDLSSAIAWTDELTGNERTSAAREVIAEYARENASEASAWLNSMANEPGYENVVASYIWNTAVSSPPLALSHVAEIENPETQTHLYEKILQRWHKHDASAAESWMDENSIPEDLRGKILRPKDSTRHRWR